jgi:hypothetical protein
VAEKHHTRFESATNQDLHVFVLSGLGVANELHSIL